MTYIAAYLAGSWFTAQEVWKRLRQRAIDVHFLMLAVAVGGASIGAWGEGAMLLFLFSFSGALEHYALGRTQKEIRSLFREAPKSATVIDPSGNEHEVPVERLRAGTRLRILPGAQFPVDAEIAKGSTAADESNLTGEATPVDKGIGDMVLAGTINLWGAVEVLVTRPAAESSLQKIIRLIKEAQHQKALAQQPFTDKFSTYYTYIVLGLSAVMFFVWWQILGLAPSAAHDAGMSAFYRTMTLLVVASPCALVLSIPSAVLAAIAWGAKHGILLRGGAAVEKLAGVTTVALDKTGTLTTGELRVEKIESLPPGQETEVARVAYSLERLSSHPLARAITRHGKQQGLESIEASGLSVSDLESLIAKRLEKYVTEPVVGVFVKEYRSQQISVLGSVKDPKVYYATGQKYLLDMLSLAGGLTSEAGSVCIIQRISPGNTGDKEAATEKIVNDLYKLLIDGNPDLNIPVHGGDVVQVPKSGIFFVDGAVKGSGESNLKNKVTFTQAISMAKGLDDSAQHSDIRINPWWPHVRRFTDYAARLTAVLSASEFQATIALLGPKADEWAREGLLYQPFPEVQRPWYHYHLWQALQQAGYGTDFVSEGVLRGARAGGGRLRYGSRSYDTLLVMDAVALEPETAEAIARFGEAGGRVVFVGRSPDRAPGLKDAAEADRRVKEAVARLLPARAGQAVIVPRRRRRPSCRRAGYIFGGAS